MKKIAILSMVFCFGFYSPMAFCEDEPQDIEKIALIRKYMEITGSLRLAKQAVKKILEVEKEGASQDEIERLNYIAANIDPEKSQEYINEVVNLYSRHFTKAELEPIVQFYSSPAGQKLITEIPSMMSEAMNVSTNWSLREFDRLNVEFKRSKVH